MVKGRYKVFPPRWRHIRVPTGSRRAALAGIALYAPCRPGGIWLQRAAWVTVGLLGTSALPGRAAPFVPPDRDAWRALCATWEEELGVFDDLAVIERRQSNRSGLAVLLINQGEPLAFLRVRLGLDPHSDPEVTSLGLVNDPPPESFGVPRVSVTGEIDGWGYVGLSPLPPLMHRPPDRAPLAIVVAEIQDRLGSLPRLPGTPEHWVPMHGDFTPWNLRRFGDGSLVLMDWERSGWGPPGADLLLYNAAEVALGRRNQLTTDHPEAVDFWRSGQGGSIEEQSLIDALDGAIAGE
jgi:hypothetical protein